MILSKAQTLSLKESTTIKFKDVFIWDNKSNYIIVNAAGANDPSSSLFVKNLDFPGQIKNIPKQFYMYDSFGIGLLYEKDSSGQYFNRKYGYLNDLWVNTPTNKNKLMTITVGDENKIDTSYIGSLANIDLTAKTVLDDEHSVAFVTTTDIKTDIVTLAKSYVGKLWPMNNSWEFIATLSAISGKTLPINTSNISGDAISDGGWVLKYDGSKSNVDWKTKVSVGDILFISSADMLDSSVSVVTATNNGYIKVINAIQHKNEIGNNIKILPEHYIGEESVYDHIYQKNTLIYSSSATVSSAQKTETTTYTYTENNQFTTEWQDPSAGLHPTIGQKTSMTTPKAKDIILGPGESFKVKLPDLFRLSSYASYDLLDIRLVNLPKWMKYDDYFNTISGTVPSKFTELTLEFWGELGSMMKKNTIKIIGDPNKVVDVKDVVWTAGQYYELSIDKKNTGVYSYRASESIDWLKIDQNSDILWGTVPKELAGHNIKVTLFEKEGYGVEYNQDSFNIQVVAPQIKVIGLYDYL
jgi:hypothetical protein